MTLTGISTVRDGQAYSSWNYNYFKSRYFYRSEFGSVYWGILPGGFMNVQFIIIEGLTVNYYINNNGDQGFSIKSAYRNKACTEKLNSYWVRNYCKLLTLVVL